VRGTPNQWRGSCWTFSPILSAYHPNPWQFILLTRRFCVQHTTTVDVHPSSHNPMAADMGPKRDNADVEGEIQEPSSKRRRDQPPAKPKIPEPKTDATYGQRSVFPSLDHPAYNSDDNLEFEDEADALAYLKSVR